MVYKGRVLFGLVMIFGLVQADVITTSKVMGPSCEPAFGLHGVPLWKTVILQGKAINLQHSALRAPGNTYVKKINVSDNQLVKSGQIIAILDHESIKKKSEILELEIQRLKRVFIGAKQAEKKQQACVQKDQLIYEMAMRQVLKQKKLLQQDVISKAQVEESEFHMEEKKSLWLQAQYQLSLRTLVKEQSQTALSVVEHQKEQIRQKMERYIIRAPYAGTMRNIMVQQGSLLQKDDVLFTITGEGNAGIQATIPYAQYQSLKQALESNKSGLPVQIQYKSSSIDAIIKAVLPNSNDTSTFGAGVWIETPELLAQSSGQPVQFSLRLPTKVRQYQVPRLINKE